MPSALGGQAAISFLPAGAMVDFAGTTAPSGWLMCDGAAVSRTVYADLFSSLGIAYGVGDGSTTFNLPDYRGRFARYLDNMGTAAGAAGRDTGRVRGADQAQNVGLHSHVTGQDPASYYGYGPVSTPGVAGGVDYTISIRHSHSTTTAVNNQSGDTRPINLSSNRIIKY